MHQDEPVESPHALTTSATWMVWPGDTNAPHLAPDGLTVTVTMPDGTLLEPVQATAGQAAESRTRHTARVETDREEQHQAAREHHKGRAKRVASALGVSEDKARKIIEALDS